MLDSVDHAILAYLWKGIIWLIGLIFLGGLSFAKFLWWLLNKQRDVFLQGQAELSNSVKILTANTSEETSRISSEMLALRELLDQKLFTFMQELQTLQARMERELGRLENEMVKWETLKRMELLLLAMGHTERESNIIKALRVEIESHDSKQEKSEK